MTVEQIAESNPIYLLGSSTSTAPAGYKQTELGIIPEDWCVSPIGQTHILATGTTPPTANTANYGDRYLFVSPADLGEAKYVLKTEKRLSERGFKLARQYPSGSTLFTCIGSTIGKTGLSREILTSNQQINAIFPSNDSDPEFVYYAVTHIAPRVKALAGQQAVPLVNKSEFGETLYCYPSSKTEQTAIANALSDVDALIQELEKLIAKKQAIKTATMQQLLTGRTRLPQFAHHPDGRKKGYKPSELGEIPEDWEVVCLGDLATIKTGSRNNQDKEANGAYPFFVRSETVERLNTFSYDCEAILVPGEGGIGSIFHYIHGKFDAHQRVYVIRNFQNCSGKFVYLQMRQNFGAHAMENSVKATVDSLRLPTFQNFTLMLPSVEEQDEVARILWDMDEEVKALGLRLNKTRQIKQGMMQELLTGKTRLVKPESSV